MIESEPQADAIHRVIALFFGSAGWSEHWCGANKQGECYLKGIDQQCSCEQLAKAIDAMLKSKEDVR